jgi:hypothetical protein
MAGTRPVPVSAWFTTAKSNAGVFANSASDDVMLYTTNEQQRVLIGPRVRGAASMITVSTSNVLVLGGMNVGAPVYAREGLFIGALPTGSQAQQGPTAPSPLPDNSVFSSTLADGCVTSPKLAPGAVVTAALGDASVTRYKLAPGAVSGGAIAPAGVLPGALAANAVGACNLAFGSVTPQAIASGAVGSAAIAPDAVTTSLIADGAVTAAKLASDVVSAVLAAAPPAFVTSALLAPDSVGTVHLQDAAVTAAKIAAAALGTYHLQDAAVTAAKLADRAVGARHLQDAAVGSAALASNLTLPGTTAVSGDLLPAADVAFDLGSGGLRWRDLHLSGNSIHLGSTVISSIADPFSTDYGDVLLRNSGTSNLQKLIVRELQIAGLCNTTVTMRQDPDTGAVRFTQATVDPITGVTCNLPLSDATNTVLDGSITTPKLADGAVTLPKLGADVLAKLSNLDLTVLSNASLATCNLATSNLAATGAVRFQCLTGVGSNLFTIMLSNSGNLSTAHLASATISNAGALSTGGDVAVGGTVFAAGFANTGGLHLRKQGAPMVGGGSGGSGGSSGANAAWTVATLTFATGGARLLGSAGGALHAAAGVTEATAAAATAASQPSPDAHTWGTADGASPLMTLSASGHLAVTGQVTSLSDARCKADVRPIGASAALRKVRALVGCTYARRDRPPGHAREAGLIAQAVRAVLPEAVCADEHGRLSVAYGPVTGLLVEAIKALDARLITLRRESRTARSARWRAGLRDGRESRDRRESRDGRESRDARDCGRRGTCEGVR